MFLGRDLNRRTFLHRLGSGFGSAALLPLLRARAAAEGVGQRRRSLILLWQDGGPSHFETFDPKPDAPVEYRGELGTTPTTLPGIRFCEVLPRLARLAHRFSVIRSLHQPSSGHVDGSHNVLTGWHGATVGGRSKYPDLATIVHRMRSGVEDAEITIGSSTDPRLAKGLRRTGAATTRAARALPDYIDIGKGIHRGGPAYLGPMWGPFQVVGDPCKPDFQVQNLNLQGASGRLQARLAVRRQLGNHGALARRGGRDLSGQMDALERFQQQAIDLLTGAGAGARAFDLTREPRKLRERYGLFTAGQQLLLARRLVEAGVSVVAVRYCPDGRGDYEKTMIGWDDHAVHGNIFAIMRQRGPRFDQSLSALIEDLEDRGMEDDVLVVVAGEFGRTPRIFHHQGCPGREHWGPAGCALVYGGGLQAGQVIGSTNAKGERPQDRPLQTQDLLATIYHSLDVDRQHTFLNEAGRPIPVLGSGKPIRELI